MDPDFWHKRWRDNDIGFHKEHVHPLLDRHWSDFRAQEKRRNLTTVLVPLCGKSQDMVWLAQRGHYVIGIELSATAIEAFFCEQNLPFEKTQRAPFVVYHHDNIELWCGDIFAAPRTIWERIDFVYDRASLVALPPKLQEQYVEFLCNNLPKLAHVFLIALTYDPREMQGPPFNISEDRIHDLFADASSIKKLRSQRVLDDNEFLKKRGLSALTEELYIITT